MSPAEQTLLQRWNDHRDAEAFSELVRRYAGLVYGTCRRILRNENEAEDVAQDCFLKLAQFRSARIDSLGGWLHRIATRESLNRLKSEQRRLARETQFATDHAQHSEIQWDDLQAWVDEALDALPDDLREPLIRHFLQDETHDEIARRLETSRSTVTRRIAQGIDQVRANLRKRGILVTTTVLSGSMAAHMAEAAPSTLRAALGRYALSGAGQMSSSERPVRSPGDLLKSPPSLPSVLAVTVAIALLAGTWWMLRERTAPQNATSHITPAAADAGSATPLRTLQPNSHSTPTPQQVSAAEPSQATPENPSVADGIETEIVSLRCVDPSGNPVVDAEVYFVHRETLAGAMTYPTSSADRVLMSAGPLITDADGCVRVEGVPRYRGRSGARGAYARVAGAWAGIWNQIAAARPPARPATSVPVREEPDTHTTQHALIEDSTSRVSSPAAITQSASESVDIVLAPAAQVRGVVTVPPDAEVTAVNVKLVTLYRRGVDRGAMFSTNPEYDSVLWPEIFETKPDDTGAFLIPDMPEDVTVYLSADGPGLANSQYMGSNFKGTTIPLVMEPESILEGRVTWEGRGEPAADVPVLVQAVQSTAITLPYIRRTDAGGNYRVTGLTPGNHTVRFLPGRQPSEHNARPQTVDLAAGQATQAPLLTLERGALVSGVFRDAKAGTPVAGASVVALYPAEIGGTAVASAKTGPDGTYEMRLPAGEFMFYLFDVTESYEYPKDQGRREVLVPAMQQSVVGIDFILTPRSEPMPQLQAATVEGLVLDEEGQPAEGATVTDSQEGEEIGSNISGPVGQTGADGRFSVKIRAANTHEIRVGGGAYTLDRSERFTPEPNQTYELDTFIVKRVSGVFTGIVVDESGAPLANAELYVSSEHADWLAENISTDNEGRFVVDPAPENDVMLLHIRKPGYGNGYYQSFRDVPSEEDRVYTLKKETDEN